MAHKGGEGCSGAVGALSIPRGMQHMQQRAHKDKTPSDTFWVKHPASSKTNSLERARLGHRLLLRQVEVPGAAPTQGEAAVLAGAQDGGFPAAEAPVGDLPARLGAAPAGEAAPHVPQQVPAEEHVNPGVAAAAEAGQQHGDGEGHVGGLWEGKAESSNIPQRGRGVGRGLGGPCTGLQGLFLAWICVPCPIPSPPAGISLLQIRIRTCQSTSWGRVLGRAPGSSWTCCFPSAPVGQSISQGPFNLG